MCALDQKQLGQLHKSGVKPEEISKLGSAFFALSCLSFPFQVSFCLFVSPRLAVYLALLFLCLAVLPTSSLISPSVFLPFLFLYSGSRPSGMEFWEW